MPSSTLIDAATIVLVVAEDTTVLDPAGSALDPRPWIRPKAGSTLRAKVSRDRIDSSLRGDVDPVVVAGHVTLALIDAEALRGDSVLLRLHRSLVRACVSAAERSSIEHGSESIHRDRWLSGRIDAMPLGDVLKSKVLDTIRDLEAFAEHRRDHHAIVFADELAQPRPLVTHRFALGHAQVEYDDHV